MVSTTSPPKTASQLRHDLLTPVNHLVGYSEMLAEELEAAGESALHQLVEPMHAAAKDVAYLIQQALPSATEEVEEGLDSLRLLLPAPLQVIVEQVAGIRSAAGSTLLPTIASDLERISTAAHRLRAMLDGTKATEGVVPAPVEPLPTPAAHIDAAAARLLVVDDEDSNRDLLTRRLEREGHRVSQAECGGRALEMLRSAPFDLVLLDVMMPDLDGFEVLRRMKEDAALREIPVIMLSARDELQSAVRGMEMGAEDYLPKPFDPVLLRARIGSCLEKKAHSDQLRAALRDVEEQKRFSESMLLNILPARISEELRTSGSVTPKYFDDISIVITDFAGFTLATEELAAEELVALLHEYFTAFDQIVRRYGLEKLKTVGDSYIFFGGMPPRSSSHPVDAVLASLEILQAVEKLGEHRAKPWKLRIGMHTGPVIAGVVGIDKFSFDIWGDTVNFASRMESSGEPDRFNLSERAYARIKDFFVCEPRGKVVTKEQRAFDMYFVNGVLPRLMQDTSAFPPPQFVRRYRTYFERDPPAFPTFLGGAA